MPTDDWEEQKPKKKKLVEPMVMEHLSIEELRELIAHFEAEVVRAQAEIDISDGTFAPGAIEIRVSVDVTFEIE